MPQLCSGIVNLGNDLMRFSSKVDCLATTIMRRISAGYPAPLFQAMQQGHERRLFNPEAGSNFRLGEWIGRDGQMKERAPFGLAQAHRFQASIQLQAPGACGPVEEEPEWLKKPVRHRNS
jgi:hypothetical protein